jgi:DNA-binding transcriptional ArsR family regulator
MPKTSVARPLVSSPRAGAPGDAFDALGDANRRAIVSMLAAGGRSVQELADSLPISRPAVSRHLRLLKEANLVTEEPRGTRRIYRLREDGLAAVRSYLDEVWAEAGARFRLMAENTSPTDSRADASGGPGAPDTTDATDRPSRPGRPRPDR